ncbi:MAG: alpha/beta hydrolase fold domain-containing protein [Gemmatimonadota bacterium]|nr:alpha/beta hydrolase fold domain-containing protein [Gemmatimonadota bacterium]
MQKRNGELRAGIPTPGSLRSTEAGRGHRTRRSWGRPRQIAAILAPIAWCVGCASSVDPGPITTNGAPTATITSPADGATFVEGLSIPFAGSASDPEDGSLAGSSLQWSSNIDGEMGTGETVTAALSVGSHAITLTAVDSRGSAGTASIGVTVNQAAPPPSTQPPGPWSPVMSYGSHSREQLKVRRPEGSATVPVFIHIPGGGWMNHNINGCNFDSDRFVRETQWALVCVDFPPSSSSFSHPGHEQSVARALDFIVSTLAGQQNLDASAIVAYGGSAGGHLAYRLAQLRPGQLIGVGAQAAPTCLTNWDTATFGTDSRCPTLSGSAAEGPVGEMLGSGATPDDAWNASPLRQFATLPPVHIQHIIQDPIVPISQARVMRDSLNARGMLLDYHEFQQTHQCEHGCGYFGHGNQLRNWLAALLGQSN